MQVGLTLRLPELGGGRFSGRFLCSAYAQYLLRICLHDGSGCRTPERRPDPDDYWVSALHMLSTSSMTYAMRSQAVA